MYNNKCKICGNFFECAYPKMNVCNACKLRPCIVCGKSFLHRWWPYTQDFCSIRCKSKYEEANNVKTIKMQAVSSSINVETKEDKDMNKNKGLKDSKYSEIASIIYDMAEDLEYIANRYAGKSDLIDLIEDGVIDEDADVNTGEEAFAYIIDKLADYIDSLDV